jgi:hypothetical protein
MDLKSTLKNNILISFFLLLGIFIGFGLDRLINSNQNSPIIIDRNMKIVPASELENRGETTPKSAGQTSGNFVASINGKAYYPTGCAAANRIKEENKVWFDTKEEAVAQGYKPAANCP